MSFESLVPFPAPEKISIKEVDGDTRVPYERIKVMMIKNSNCLYESGL